MKLQTVLIFLILVAKGLNPNVIQNSLLDAWMYIKKNIHCMAPNSIPKEEDVQFFLFTKAHVNRSQEIKNFMLNTTNFNKSLETKILIHGYTQSYKNELFVNMKNVCHDADKRTTCGYVTQVTKANIATITTTCDEVFLSKHSLNVIMVNWEKLAASPCYPVAADYTEFVGQLTAYLLKQMDPKKIHVIGFSLGAHIAGIAAQIQEKKILRVTGLDPAMPMFANSPISERLDVGDAINVDVIHTSVLGYSSKMGHADFFVNGAMQQPDCKTSDLSCSHRRSVELYIITIKCRNCLNGRLCDSQNDFNAGKCNNHSISPMGETWINSGARRGAFYLNVNRSILHSDVDSLKKSN